MTAHRNRSGRALLAWAALWTALVCVAALLWLAAAPFRTGGVPDSSPSGAAAVSIAAANSRRGPATQLEWIHTVDGRRMGLALACDLTRAGDAWQLLGPTPDEPPLRPLGRLLPPPGERPRGFAVNGGFWNEERFPVGVCAGEAGIYAARSHPYGFALLDGRMVIGPLHSEVRLIPLAAADTPAPRPAVAKAALEAALSDRLPVEHPASVHIAESPVGPSPPPATPQPIVRLSVEAASATILLNPAALPPGLPFLIDFRTYTRPVQPPARVRAVRLRASRPGPLRFNQPLELEAVDSEMVEADTLYAPRGRELVLFEPEGLSPSHAASPARWRLEPWLRSPSPLGADTISSAPVRLATCAGPILMLGGVINERLDDNRLRAERAERTVIGVNAAGDRLWVLVLTRGGAGEPGVTLHEAAELLRQRGATEALNLDGGSSTSAWAADADLQLRALLPIERPVHHILYYARPVALR